MPFSTLFFDLDETLYPASCGLWELIKERMNLFMEQRLGIPADDVPDIRDGYFKQYGTTLRGLQANHQVDADEYLAFVHDIPLQDYLHPDPQLRSMLLSLPQKKFIFTNADARHAGRVLDALGLQDCFDGVVDIRLMDPWCKPMDQSFQVAQYISGEPNPQHCVLMDDLPHNTRQASAHGFYSILVGQSGPIPEANACLPSLLDLPLLLDRAGELLK